MQTAVSQEGVCPRDAWKEADYTNSLVNAILQLITAAVRNLALVIVLTKSAILVLLAGI